jgi:hypothetical protein
MEESSTKVMDLQSIYAEVLSHPTEERISQAVSAVEAAGKHFSRCEEIHAAAMILALRDSLKGVETHDCDDPRVCGVMRHLEYFLAVEPGLPYNIPRPIRDEVLKDVRAWRTSTIMCNPCRHSSTVIQRGLDPMMFIEDQARAVEESQFHARTSS